MGTHDLRGKVAVVLGASAKKGIGWATALALGNAGAKVVVGARTFEPLEELAREIDGTAFACDGGNEAQVEALAKKALDTYGRLDIAVNLAATNAPALVQDFSIEQVRKVFEVNYFGNIHFLKYMSLAMEPKMRENEGSIILMSSVTSTLARVPLFPYGTSKSALDSLVRYAALELAPKHIKVNSILPGPIHSDMTGDFFAVPGVQEAYCREIPLGWIGYPKDIADAVMWLADGAYVTGLNLHVSGGMHLTRFPYPDEYPEGAGEALKKATPRSERGE